MVVRLLVERGRILRASVVYSAEFDGQWREVFRADNAHGVFHKHLLFLREPRGEAIAAVATGEAVDAVVTEIEENWVRFRKLFYWNHVMGGKDDGQA